MINELRKSYKHVIDLTYFESQGKALEGKGSLVTDHSNKRLYCALSCRANLEVLEEYANQLNKYIFDHAKHYQIIPFRGYDADETVIYHTDCFMTIQNNHALICLDAIKNQNEKRSIINSLTDCENPLEIIDLSYEQMEAMCANA